MMYGYADHMSGWGYAFMTITMVALWALVIIGLVALVRFLTHTGRSQATEQAAKPPATPEQLLAERFARGEIDPDEYRKRLEILRGDARTAPGGR
ncbi:MAG TPA: SHOCT domain-containing protein [Streptosporangiaceae bacterium]|nr:SHOCT domain-containing protein [Streptosporangiaceae bacterium]